jgi:hypothetical protein
MRPLVLSVPLIALVAACSTGGTSGSSATPPALVLPTEVATATPAATTEGPRPVATTAAPVPTPTTRRKPALDGDVDGDGKPDAIRATSTLLTVDLSGTGTRVTAPVHSEGPSNAAVLGVTDVDHDGYAEVFLQTAQGASTVFATPYRFDGTRLHELQLDGGPVRLGIGGTVLRGEGFSCTSTGLLDIRSADSTDGQAFTVHSSTYRLGLDQLAVVKSVTVKANQGEPAVERSYNVDCGPVGSGE